MPKGRGFLAVFFGKMMSSGSSASYLYNGELDEHKVSKKVLFAHQMIENPDEDYEEILNF